jgi:2-amino-4-hydroxy-6-hydroxymethyldihydropteridine diphosphokinase
MTLCALSLGSNMGNRLDNIRRAVGVMRPLGSVTAKSEVYETPPWGILAQPRFLNACVLLETETMPLDLLAGLKDIERGLGRVQREHWGPREIDIDILTYGDEVLEEPGLVVPHPFMKERAFVLRPLFEIAPDLKLPPDGGEIARLIEKLDTSGIIRIVQL